ncbi:Protein tpx2 [Mactra antiquata]
MEDSYDFNAPQFVDFTGPVGLEGDDQADRYFDFDHENNVPVKFDESINDCDAFSTPQSEVKRITSNTDTPDGNSSKRVLRSNTPSDVQDGNKSQRDLRSNTPSDTKDGNSSQRVLRSNTPSEKLLTSSNLDEIKKKTAGTKTPLNSIKTNTTKTNVNKKLPEGSMKRGHRSLERSDSLPKRQRPAMVNSTSKVSQSSSLQRSSSFSTLNGKQETRQRNHSRGVSSDRQAPQRPRSSSREVTGDNQVPQRPRSSSRSSSTTESDKKGVTIPTTPTFLKRKQMKMPEKVKPTEEMELEKIDYFRQQLAKSRKLAQESCKTALGGKAPTLSVQHKELTKPEEFKFETDSRIKSHPVDTKHDSDSKDFARILRSGSGKQTTTKCGLTKPEPFSFGSQRKRKMSDLDEKQAERYESMAERLAHYTKTPERFRSKVKGPTEEKRGRSRSPPHPTVPKTPQFETRTRSRPVTAPSRADLEKKEVEEMQKKQFKAQPVNHKIFENSCLGIKRVAPKAPTVPEEFHLSSKNRGLEKPKEKEEHYEFHAQPLNKKILDGPVGIKDAKKGQVTIPQSPAFALKHRARLPVVEEPKDDKPVLRSRAAPHFGLPFQPQTHHKKTEPEPFGFEEREKQKAEERKKKMEQMLEEERKQREFHANPLPDLEPHLPSKKKRPLTVKQPFNLDTDIRGAKKTKEWSKKLEEELHQQIEKTRFKAKDAHVLEQEPFIPHKENKHTTADISEFEFNTAKRLVKRDVYETHKKAKQDAVDNIRKQEQKMKEAEERAEMERLRKEAVHKAQPIKRYRNVEVRPSDRPLTHPMTPKFSTDTRLRSRTQHGESFMSS